MWGSEVDTSWPLAATAAYQLSRLDKKDTFAPRSRYSSGRVKEQRLQISSQALGDMLHKKRSTKLLTRPNLILNSTVFDPKAFNSGGISSPSLPILLPIVLSSTRGPIMAPKLTRLHPLRVLIRRRNVAFALHLAIYD